MAHLVLAVNTPATRDRPAARGPAAGVGARAAPPAGTGREPFGAPEHGDGVRRYVSQGRYGTIVVDVVGDTLYVNGEPVERAAGAKV